MEFHSGVISDQIRACMAVPKSPTKNQPPKEGDKNPEKSQFMASKAPSLINKSNP